jgi:putative aldouronate transport system permease protein
MSLAPLVFILIFQYLPMAGLVIVFQDYDIFAGFADSPWVGVSNFREVFSDAKFWQVLRNTFIINFYKVVFFFPIPIALAIVVTEIPNRIVQRVGQTILYLPHFVSWIVIAGLTFTLLGSNGTINQILSAMGLGRVSFLTRPELFRGIVVSSAIWKEAGWGAIIFIAAIISVDPELFEAAIMDGAGRVRRIWSITLPSILSTIIVLLLIRLGYILLWGTEQILAMYNPTVYETGDVVGTYVFRTGLGSQRYSYSATVGFFNSLVGFIMIIGANALSRRLTDRSIW